MKEIKNPAQIKLSNDTAQRIDETVKKFPVFGNRTQFVRFAVEAQLVKYERRQEKEAKAA